MLEGSPENQGRVLGLSLGKQSIEVWMCGRGVSIRDRGWQMAEMASQTSFLDWAVEHQLWALKFSHTLA